MKSGRPFRFQDHGTVAREQSRLFAKSKDEDKTHIARMRRIIKMIDDPVVVLEIDRILKEMRHEWNDMLQLRQSAVRRHGDVL